MEIVPPPGSSDKTFESAGKNDIREQLFNEGLCGKATEIQVSTERIAKVRGILFDLDPKHFQKSPLVATVPHDVNEFYSTVVRPMLQQHPVLQHAEVRNTGTGVHALLCFESPVTILSDEDRQRWIGIIKTVQAALPIDPDQPDITALTRPIGAINSKNGGEVTLLQQGRPVSQDQILALHKEMCEAPFMTVMKILGGANRIEPCPICEAEGSCLDGLNWVGKCYGSCGTVKLERLYDSVLVPRKNNRKEVVGDDASTD